VSGEAILSAEYGGKPLAGRGSALNPAGGTHSAPPARYVTSHPGQLSLAIPPWVGSMSTGDRYGHRYREENGTVALRPGLLVY